MQRYMMTAALIAFAAPVCAQELTFGKVGYDYLELSSDGNSFDRSRLMAEAEFGMNAWLFGGGLNSATYDTGSGDGTIRNFYAFAGYMPLPEVLVGAGLSRVSYEDEDFNGFEVFGQYDNGQYAAGVTYVEPDTDADDVSLTGYYAQANLGMGVTLGAVLETSGESDESLYVLSAEYDDGPFFGRLHYLDVTDEDASILGIRGSYDINDMFAATATLDDGEGFFGGYTSFSVGADYSFTQTATASLKLGRIERDSGAEADSVMLALNFDLGDRVRLDRRMNEAIREDRENGIVGFVPDVGIGTGLAF